MGPLGLSFSMLMFGMSTTFWPLVFMRTLQGAFNGNIGELYPGTSFCFISDVKVKKLKAFQKVWLERCVLLLYALLISPYTLFSDDRLYK